MLQRTRTTLLYALPLLLLATLLLPTPSAMASQWPGPGWIHAGPITGGCNDEGECDSKVGDIISGLFEYVPDQEIVSTNYSSADLSQHGGAYPTFVKRERCYIKSPSGSVQLGWSAGVWHHAATWQLIDGIWYDSNHHWAFQHDDKCEVSTPTPAGPTPTATQIPPTPTTPALGQLRVNVYRCSTSGPPHATNITAEYPGSVQTETGTSSAVFNVPQGYRTRVTAAASGIWRSASTNGFAGQTINLVVTTDNPADCLLDPTATPTATADPSIPTPTTDRDRTPTPTPPLPPVGGGPGSQYVNVELRVGGQKLANYPVTFVSGGAQTVLNTGSDGRTALLWSSLVADGQTLDVIAGARPDPRLKLKSIYTTCSGTKDTAAGAFRNIPAACNLVFDYDFSRNSITLQLANMSGTSLGVLANRDVTIRIVNAGGSPYRTWTAKTGSDGKVWVSTSEMQRGDTMQVLAAIPDGYFVWKIDSGSCTGSGNVVTGSFAGITGECNLTYTFVKQPSISARVLQRADDGSPIPLSGVSIAVSDQSGTQLTSQASNADGFVNFLVTPEIARLRVGQTAWHLVPPAEATTASGVQPLGLVIPGTNAIAETDRIKLVPIGQSVGSQFIFGPPPEPEVLIQGYVRLTNGDALANSVVTISTGSTVLYNGTTGSDGQFWYRQAFPGGVEASTYTVRMVRGPAGTKPQDAIPETQTGRMSKINVQTLQLGVEGGASSIASVGNQFVLTIQPPELEPDIRTYIRSRHDKENNESDPKAPVYLAERGEITWPQGEVLDWTPFVDPKVPTSELPGYRFKARVVAWSYVSTTVNGAELNAKTSSDSRSLTGCRDPRKHPTSADTAGTNTSDMEGCVYGYVANPNKDDMTKQAHTYLSMVLPTLDLPQTAYVYQLSKLEPAKIDVQVKFYVWVEAVDPLTGIWREVPNANQTQIVDSSFLINLVTPRSVR